jgi:hypothetical protein
MRHRRRRLGVVSASASSSSDVSSHVVSSCVGAWMLHRVPSSLSRCDTSTHLRARLSRPRDPLSTTRKLGVNPTTINQPIKPSLNQPRASVETETYIDLIPSTETRVRDGLSKTHHLPAELADGTHTLTACSQSTRCAGSRLGGRHRGAGGHRALCCVDACGRVNSGRSRWRAGARRCRLARERQCRLRSWRLKRLAL